MMWTGAIFVCLLLVLFSLVFASCANGGAAESASPSPDAVNTHAPDNTAAPGSAAPAEGSTAPDATGSPDVSDAPETQVPGITSPETTPEATPEATASTEPSTTPSAEPSTAPSAEPSASPAPTTAVTVPGSTRLAQTGDMGQEYLDKFVFLGDSTTYGLGYYNIVDDTQVWTPSNGTLTLDQWNYVRIVYPETGEELMLTELLTLKQPEYLCITLGVNGVSFMTEDYFKQTYTALVQKVQEVSPGTTIILNSIYPVTTGYEAKGNGINNLKISAANLWVESVAAATGAYYLDSASVLKDANQVLPDSYTNGDGLHLNADSFGLVVSYIRTHGC